MPAKLCAEALGWPRGVDTLREALVGIPVGSCLDVIRCHEAVVGCG